jgi:hypothetical protein
MCDAMRRYAMTAAVVLAGATAVQAQGLPDVPTGTVLTEVMMDAQSSEAFLYGALLGVNPNSPQSLSGTTFTDLSTASFSFSLNPGSTYLGQAISDSAQGSWDPTSGSYLWSASGSWGDPIPWDVTGQTIPIEIDPAKPTWKLMSLETIKLKGIGDFQLPDSATLLGSGKNGPALSFATWSILDQVGRPLWERIGTDTYDPKTNTFRFQDLAMPKNLFRPFSDATTGTTPFAGGAGTFTTSIGAVPEPSTLLMFPLGILGMIGYVRWTRKAAEASARQDMDN